MPQRRELLSLVQYAMAVQDIRYYLNGLCCLSPTAISCAGGTDGHRLVLPA